MVHPTGKGFQMGEHAVDGAVGIAPQALFQELPPQKIDKRPRQARRPQCALIAALFLDDVANEGVEIAPLHLARAFRRGCLEAKIRLEPVAQGVVFIGVRNGNNGRPPFNAD